MLRTSSNAVSARNRSREREINELIRDSRPNVQALGRKLAEIRSKMEVPNFLSIAPSSAAAAKTEPATSSRGADNDWGGNEFLDLQTQAVELVGALTALKVSYELLNDRVRNATRANAHHALKLTLTNADKTLSVVKKLYEEATRATRSAKIDEPTRFQLATETLARDDLVVDRIRTIQNAAREVQVLEDTINRAKSLLERTKSRLDEAFYKEASLEQLSRVSKEANEALRIAASVQKSFLGAERTYRARGRANEGEDLTREVVEKFQKLKTEEEM